MVDGFMAEKRPRHWAAEISKKPVRTWLDEVNKIPDVPTRELVKTHLRICHERRVYERKKKAAIEAAKQSDLARIGSGFRK